MRDMLPFLGCTDPETLRRLGEHEDLAAAWEAGEDASDLAWLAARVAPSPADRIMVAIALLHIAELVSADATEGSRGALGGALGLVDQLFTDDEPRAVDPSGLTRELGAELQLHAKAARGELARVERKLRGRAQSAPLSERVVFSTLEGVRLVLDGGWKGRAAGHAQTAIRQALALRPDLAAAELLRAEIPFTTFRTALWTARPTRAPEPKK